MSSSRGLLAELLPSSCVDGPGNRFVVFMQGCNLNCLACHNPQTIAPRPIDGARWHTVDGVVAAIEEAAPFISGVTVSGGEPTLQWRFVSELLETLAGHERLGGLGRLIDSNGCADRVAWDALSPWIDGVMLDLKALDPEVHLQLTGHGNEAVLTSLEHLAEIGKLHEVRLLLVPGVNDTRAQLHATGRYLTGVDPQLRVRVLGFRHTGTRPVADRFGEPTDEALEDAVGHLVEAGLARDRVVIGGSVARTAC